MRRAVKSRPRPSLLSCAESAVLMDLEAPPIVCRPAIGEAFKGSFPLGYQGGGGGGGGGGGSGVFAGGFSDGDRTATAAAPATLRPSVRARP